MAHPTVSNIVSNIQVSAFEIPTGFPKSDGTIVWNEAPVAVVRLAISSCEGLGYRYPDAAAAHLIRTRLSEIVVGMNPVAIPAV